MLLTVKELISLLRSSVNIQSDDSGVVDPAYLQMTDDDIELFIKLGVSRAYPEVSDLSELSGGSEYPIILLAKIELYLKLAVLRADKVDMGADNNNYLKNSQRFGHYMKLAEEVRAEYDSWLDNEGGAGGTGVTSFDVLLSNRHYTQRNFEKQAVPKVFLYIDSVASDTVSFSWRVTNTSHFGRFKVYISKKPIVDMYKEGGTYDKKVDKEATLVVSTSNIKNVFHKVSNLEADTTYYLAVISIERNQVFGYSEKSFTTPKVLEDEDEVSENTL